MFITSFYAQDSDSCVFDEGEVPEFNEITSVIFDVNPINTIEPIVLNVFFWKVNDPNGNYNPGGNPNNEFTEYKVLEAVSHLNQTYNEFNIFFKYIGYDSFDSPPNTTLFIYQGGMCVVYPNFDPHGYGMVRRCQITEFFNYVTNNGYKHPNAINIYAPYATEHYRGAANYNKSTAIVKPQDFTNFVNPHEIAHLLGLGHTRSGNENVPRDPQHADFNASWAGDKIVETAAINSYRDPNNPSTFPFVNLQTCIYTNDGSQTDSNDVPYNPFPQDVSNIMSDCSPCMLQYPNFFDEQFLAMRHKVLSNPTKFEPLQNTVASLYEPYRGEYYISGPVGINHPPLFQPGFRYRFRECQCDCPDGEPTPYEDTSFTMGYNTLLMIEADETDFSSITHPNHSAIQILFNPPLPDSYGQNTRKCYDNWNRAPIGGSITKFNDGVFNANVTITSQDSTAINNPNLIQQLDPGLYRIDKNYEDGAVQENVIYKEIE